MSSAHPGPHQSIAANSPAERFLAQLFDRLWEIYRQRVAYVQTYEKTVAASGATFVNDHIAFRTFATQQPLNGIASLSRILESLGYRAAGVYHFEDKHLGAVHFQHPNYEFPKLFISELKLWETPQAADIIYKYAKQHRPAISAEVLTDLNALARGKQDVRDSLLETVLDYFTQLPWPAPDKQDVLELNKTSQYAAWVLVHGYNVNHFTSLVNSHGVKELNDLEKTIEALKRAGVPMKAEIEGAPKSKLRQSATEAVTIDVDVLDQGKMAKMPWTYAYFELAERNTIVDPETGKQVRFEGFLGPQATNLFEMTRVK